MHIIKTVSAAVIASTLLLGATACGNDQEEAVPGTTAEQTQKATPSPSSNSNATSTETAAATPVASEATNEEDRLAALGKANSLIAFVKDPGTVEILVGNPEIPMEMSSKEKVEILKTSNPEVFYYFDTPDEESYTNAYGFVSMLTNMMSVSADPDITFDQITIDGDTAHAVTDKPLTAGMQPEGMETPVEGFAVDMVKKDGKWLIVAPSMDQMLGM